MNQNLAYQDETWEELVGGKIVAMSPRPTVNHSFIASNIYYALRRFFHGKRCTPFADGVDLYLTEEDQYIPDGMVVCDPEKIRPNGVHGAPDLVLEVLSPSTARYDRGRKKDIYEACGVREYWIADPANKTLEQYVLMDGKLLLFDAYAILPDWMLEKMKPGEREKLVTTFSSAVFPELRISLEDVFARVENGL